MIKHKFWFWFFAVFAVIDFLQAEYYAYHDNNYAKGCWFLLWAAAMVSCAKDEVK